MMEFGGCMGRFDAMSGGSIPEVLLLEGQLQEARATIALLIAEREILVRQLEVKNDRQKTL